MDLGRPSTDHHKICTLNSGGVSAENLLSKILLPDLYKIWRGKTSIPEDRHQVKAHNLETAQYINKQISYVSTRINALQNGIKLGAITPRRFSAA